MPRKRRLPVPVRVTRSLRGSSRPGSTGASTRGRWSSRRSRTREVAPRRSSADCSTNRICFPTARRYWIVFVSGRGRRRAEFQPRLLRRPPRRSARRGADRVQPESLARRKLSGDRRGPLPRRGAGNGHARRTFRSSIGIRSGAGSAPCRGRRRPVSAPEPRLLIATGNPGKVREIRAALAGAPVSLCDLEEALGATSSAPDPPEESGSSFVANAGIKALHYARASGMLALGEDSGLEVDALDGAPGVRSARWMGRETPYPEKNRRLLALVGARCAERGSRRPVSRSAIAVAAGGRILFRASGIVEGRIAEAPRGNGGFGYDPVFLLPDRGRTMAELTLAEKQRISHRGRALAAFRALPRRCPFYTSSLILGAWRSLVARLLWEQEAGGSNPLAPTPRRPARGRRRARGRSRRRRGRFREEGVLAR